MGSIVVFAPQRKNIQCHLWHCEKAYRPYCSSSHSELAVQGEEGRNAIVIADGMKDKEMYEISGKIVRSKEEGKRCGIPIVDPNDLCTNPWELAGFVFFRELELDETCRSWVFFCEKNPENFGSMWKSVGVPKEISPGIFCQKYKLTRDQELPGGRFLLSQVTERGRFSLALYWMTFLAAEPKVESEEEGKVTVVTSEGETSKRKQIESDTSQLPNKVTRIGRVDGAMETPNTNVMDLTKLTTKEFTVKFGLDDNAIDSIGHAIALHTNGQHLHQPALDTVKECILSGLLSVDGVKLWKFRGEENAPAHLGASRDYNVDMMLEFMMGNGKLVRSLIHTDVTKYPYFKAVDGSYVFVKGKVQKVPVTPMEAMKSSLMGIFEKRRAGKFFGYVEDHDEKDNPKTHNAMDLTKLTTKELIAKFGIDDNTVDLIGHAIALHTNGQHLHQPALDTVMRMKLYAESLARFEGWSPYSYPLYGLRELPQVRKIDTVARAIATTLFQTPTTLIQYMSSFPRSSWPTNQTCMSSDVHTPTTLPPRESSFVSTDAD